MIKALCIDSKNMPPEIFLGDWISEGMVYHITHIYFHPEQGIQGVELREVKLTEKSKPYETYRLSRFAINQDQIQEFMELAEACSGLDSVSVEDLIKESELQIIN